MAPFSFLSAAVSCLARSSIGVVSCTRPLPRSTTVFPAIFINPLKYLSSEPSGRPKRPLNGFLKYVQGQQPILSKQYPYKKPTELMKTIAENWRAMSLIEKQPFEDAFQRDREKFKIEIQQYNAQLSPVEVQQQALERKQKLAKKRAKRHRQELINLGKPKGPRSPFNIYMSENFEEARGVNVQAKMRSMVEDWKSLLTQKKQVYCQLAEDDKMRYKNEMQSWENHLVEIGREDLISKIKRKKTNKKSR